MKKLFLLSFAAVAALTASAEYAPGTCAAVADYKDAGFKFTLEWGSDALVGNGTIRAGVGYNDQFFFVVTGATASQVPVYGKKGLSETISVAGSGWPSATADDAGHILIRTATNDVWPSDGAYAGSYYAEDGHQLAVIDGTTGAVLGYAEMNDGLAGRFDALGHVCGDVTDGSFWELAGVGDGVAGVNDFMFEGLESLGCEVFPLVINKAFAGSGAGAGKTTGSGQIFGDFDEDLGQYTNMAVYGNPVLSITGSTCPLGLGNGIELYQYGEDEEGVSAWRPADKFIITPQHASNNGFVIFRLDGNDYIAYTSGESAPGIIDCNAMAISLVSFADTPANGANDTDVLVARMYPNDETYYKPESMFTCFNVEYIPNDPLSVYIYMFTQGAPMVKTKFTVPAGFVAGVNDVIAEDNTNAPVEYFNLQGVRVNNPENGLFIKKQGNKATKVVL